MDFDRLIEREERLRRDVLAGMSGRGEFGTTNRLVN